MSYFTNKNRAYMKAYSAQTKMCNGNAWLMCRSSIVVDRPLSKAKREQKKKKIQNVNNLLDVEC